MLTDEEQVYLDEIEMERRCDKLGNVAELYWFMDNDDIRSINNILRQIGGY